MLVKTGIAKGGSPFAGARGVLALSSSSSRRRRQRIALESPVISFKLYPIVGIHDMLGTNEMKGFESSHE